MKESIALLACFSLVGCQPAPEAASEDVPEVQLSGTWIDLSYPFDENTIYWPTDEQGFQLDTVFVGITEQDYYYSSYRFSAAEHGGTHLDAPVHFAQGQPTVDQIPLEKLIGPAVVIDVSEKALADPDFLVGVEDMEQWEEQQGEIPDDVILLLRTGYGQFWPDRHRYLGTEAVGPEAVSQLHFPGLDPVAAQWLIDHRKIKAIGIGTPSLDYGQSQLFESHRILFSHGIPAFENVARLDELPLLGSFVVALPMYIKGGSGGPLRIAALIN